MLKAPSGIAERGPFHRREAGRPGGRSPTGGGELGAGRPAAVEHAPAREPPVAAPRQFDGEAEL